jgi:ankyrin repeat protein/uncharacterized protein YkwD
MKTVRIAMLLAAVSAFSGCLCSAGFPGGEYAAQKRAQPWWSMNGWDLARIDTARNVDYLTPAEKDVILAVNMARTDPQRYGREVVEPLLKCFRGTFMLPPGDPEGEQTNEGVSPVRELAAYLRGCDPLPPFTPSAGLSLGARDHALDQGRTGAVGHTGSDGSQPVARAQRHGASAGSTGEAITYGRSDGFRAVLDLLIDDGVPDRGHRLGLMEPHLRKAGVAIGPHPRYGSVTVIDCADAYFERDSRGRIGVSVDFDAWKDGPLDTARANPEIPSIERDIILGINAARGDPKGFVREVLDPLFAAAFEEEGLLLRPDGGTEKRTSLAVMINGAALIYPGVSLKDVAEVRRRLAARESLLPLRLAAPLNRAATAELKDVQRTPQIIVYTGAGTKFLRAARLGFGTIDSLTLTIPASAGGLNEDVVRAQLACHIAYLVLNRPQGLFDPAFDGVGVAQASYASAGGGTAHDFVVYLADGRCYWPTRRPPAATDPRAQKFFTLVAAASPAEVRAALKGGAPLRDRTAGGFTALMSAAFSNPRPEVVSILLQAGAKVEDRTDKGETALMWAAQSNPNQAVVSALLKAGARVDDVDKDGMTALMWAAHSNPNPEVVSALLQAGARVDGADGDGVTALMWAAHSNSNAEVVSALIRAGTKIDESTEAGETALMYAAESNPNPEVISALLAAGADGKARDRFGETAFDHAGRNAPLKATGAYQRLKEAAR